jgi:hypothetical protein
MRASDLVLTENCFSVTVGKAAYADVPAVAWRNRFHLQALVGRLGPRTPASILQLVLEEPQAIEPWLSYPGWPLELEREMRVLEDNSLANAFSRLELFGGEETVEELRRLLLDAASVEHQREARLAYAKGVMSLPDFPDALGQALSMHEAAK